MPLPEVLASLAGNPYFGAGFGLLGVGTGMAFARMGLKHSIDYFRRTMLISLDVPNKDKSFNWLLQWITEKSGHKTQHLTVETSFRQFENGEITTSTQFLPSTGIHYIFYGGRWIKLERTREKSVVDFSSGNLWENITLTTVGRSPKVFQDLLEDARKLALKGDQGSTIVYVSRGSDWTRFGFPRKRRPVSTVLLKEGQAEKILSDCRDFLRSPQWYMDRGIPYRRGFLLHGPPGCGKSSFITSLAGELHMNICVLNLHTDSINDDMVNALLNNAPQKSIILLEDIDAAADTKNAKPYSKVTFSGLLNALDGVTATEGGGRIVFMTTNNYDKLHPALIRPGRVDVIEEFGLASTYQIKKIYLKFFPQHQQLAEEFSKLVPENAYSMAEFQGHMLLYKNSPEEAAKTLPQKRQ